MIGPLSVTIEIMMIAGSDDLAPNRIRLFRVSSDKTTPMAAPAKRTRKADFDPISSSWRISSRISYGGVTAARKTRPQKKPISPNHSKNAPGIANPDTHTAPLSSLLQTLYHEKWTTFLLGLRPR